MTPRSHEKAPSSPVEARQRVGEWCDMCGAAMAPLDPFAPWHHHEPPTEGAR